jgi:hypothetical protein
MPALVAVALCGGRCLSARACGYPTSLPRGASPVPGVCPCRAALRVPSPCPEHQHIPASQPAHHVQDEHDEQDDDEHGDEDAECVVHGVSSGLLYHHAPTVYPLPHPTMKAPTMRAMVTVSTSELCSTRGGRGTSS